jgi:hypothetical protein
MRKRRGGGRGEREGRREETGGLHRGKGEGKGGAKWIGMRRKKEGRDKERVKG